MEYGQEYNEYLKRLINRSDTTKGLSREMLIAAAFAEYDLTKCDPPRTHQQFEAGMNRMLTPRG